MRHTQNPLDPAQPPLGTPKKTPPANSDWLAVAASSIGKSHLDTGLPNQDRFFYQQAVGFSAAVVADGAGSAKLSEQGAQWFSQAVGEALVRLGQRLLSSPPNQENVFALIVDQLTCIREQLLSQLSDEPALALGASLRDYHTTLTAVLLMQEGAYKQQALVIQIGDSPVLSSQFVRVGQQIDYFAEVQLLGDDSKQEYVNETHFITQDNWQDFLRISWQDTHNTDLIALMSDGCADLVLKGASLPPQVYRPFFANLLFNVCHSDSQETGSDIIYQAISNPATYRLTGDDKTLVLLIKNSQSYQAIEPLIEPIMDEAAHPPAFNSQSSVWTNQTTRAPLATHTDKVPPTTPKPLPQSRPISPATKQRRSAALFASLVVVAGVTTLAWLNKAQWLPNQGLIKAQAPVAPAVAPDLPVPMLSPPSQAYALNNAVLVIKPREQFVLPVLMAIPNSKQKKGNISRLPLFDGKSGMVTTTLINPNRAPFNHATASAISSNKAFEERVSYQYQFHCQVVALTSFSQYQSWGINQLPDHDYQYCDVAFGYEPNLSFNFVIDPAHSQVLIQGGMAELIGQETTPALAQQITQLGDTLSAIQVYFLPATTPNVPKDSPVAP
jgi:serine/threonine protein phosphatase PrpC